MTKDRCEIHKMFKNVFKNPKNFKNIEDKICNKRLKISKLYTATEVKKMPQNAKKGYISDKEKSRKKKQNLCMNPNKLY